MMIPRACKCNDFTDASDAPRRVAHPFTRQNYFEMIKTPAVPRVAQFRDAPPCRPSELRRGAPGAFR